MFLCGFFSDYFSCLNSNTITSMFLSPYHFIINRVDGVMVNVSGRLWVRDGCEPRSGHSKDYAISICCFSAKHAALRSKKKDC